MADSIYLMAELCVDRAAGLINKVIDSVKRINRTFARDRTGEFHKFENYHSIGSRPFISRADSPQNRTRYQMDQRFKKKRNWRMAQSALARFVCIDRPIIISLNKSSLSCGRWLCLKRFDRFYRGTYSRSSQIIG